LAEPAPQDQVLASSDRGRRVKLEEPEPFDGVEDVSRPLRIEHLRRDRNLACALVREANHSGTLQKLPV
jgi:hypothetical protein